MTKRKMPRARRARVDEIRERNLRSRQRVPSRLSPFGVPGLGAKVRAERVDMGLTVRQFARLVGVHHPTIVNLEQENRYGGISLPLLARIARKLNVSADYLLGLSKSKVRTR